MELKNNGLIDYGKVNPKFNPIFKDSNTKNVFTILEQEILYELEEIENSGKFDTFFSRLTLLKKIYKAKIGINKLVLGKVKWYLKVLISLNNSDKETMDFLKTSLIDLLDVEELEYGRSLESPFLVGFDRDKNGKVIPLYGNRIFRSERNINISGILISPDSRKEVSLIPGSIKQIGELELKKTEFWELLPVELRLIFETGNILQTTGVDLYDLSGKYQKDAFKQDTQCENLQRIDENITIGLTTEQLYSGISKYMLLYYGEYKNNENGRTGVLVENINGKLEPVKVEIEGVEYILEIKGCGLRIGGFGEMQSRTGREILSGGLEKNQAIKEFEVLKGIQNGDGPKVAGVVTFTNSGYEQGQIIRLSPSTVRASYTGNNCYENIEDPKNIEKVLDVYISGFVTMLSSNTPRIISRSSHTENLLLYGDGKYCWTDYSDQLFLDSNTLPFNTESGGFLTVKRLLFFVIEMRKEISGYNDENFKSLFIEKFIYYFKEIGINLDINSNSTDEEITNEIWQKFLAYKTFKEKLNSGFFPEKIKKSFEIEKEQFLLGYDNLKDFQEKFISSVLEFKKLLEKDFEGKNQYQELINSILEDINQGNYKQFLNKDFINIIYKNFFGTNNKIINFIIQNFLTFDFNDIILFIESEINMLESSYDLANEKEKNIIIEGLKFYTFKLEYIKKVNNFELKEIFEFIESFNFDDFVYNFQ